MNAIIIFLTGFFIGGIIEYALTMFFEFLERKPLKINHRFTVGKRISLLSLPIWGLIALLFTKNSGSYINIFIVSAIVGTLLEAILGKFIKKFFGVNIWTYQHGSLGNFTSLYSLPYWGGAGLVFGYIAKFFGL